MNMRNSTNVVRMYRKRAKRYDLSANLYRLIGFRVPTYRKMAVARLGLQPGDTVVEIGCGTGLNFPILQEVVGPDGRIVGVDLTDAMLTQARKRVAEHGWNNVELVQCDARAFQFPEKVDGILSTLALSLVPDLELVIRNGCQALSPGRRWVVLDLKVPSAWYARLLVPLLKPIVAPFVPDYEETLAQRPWDAVWASMNAYLEHTSLEALYLGFAYIASGERQRVNGKGRMENG